MTAQVKTTTPKEAKTEQSITAILMGASGTGKTSLVYPFVKSVGAGAVVIQSSASRGFKFLPVAKFSANSPEELKSLINRAATAPAVKVVVLDDFDYVCRDLTRHNGANAFDGTRDFLAAVEPALYRLFASGKSVFITMKAVPSQQKVGNKTEVNFAPFLGPVTGRIVDGLVDVVAHCFVKDGKRWFITQPETSVSGTTTANYFAKCRIGLPLPARVTMGAMNAENGCSTLRDELIKAFGHIDSAAPAVDVLAGGVDEIADDHADDGMSAAEQLALGGE